MYRVIKYDFNGLIDQLGDNTTEIKHRISQTRKAVNVLNSIWWHKNTTKNRKLYMTTWSLWQEN